MRTYASYSIKGGVGKTSTAVNLAYLSAADGYRTLLWDLDPQGAATFLLRLQAEVLGGSRGLIRGRTDLVDAVRGTEFEDLHVVPADFRYRNMDRDLDEMRRPTRQLRKMLEPLRDAYDVVVLDCPPSISLVSENVLHAADLVLVPLTPVKLSLRTLDQLVEFLGDFDGHAPEILGYFSMVDRRKKLHREVVDGLADGHRALSEVVIPSRSIVEQMAERQVPVPVFAPRHEVALRYRELWEQVRPVRRGAP